VVVYTNIDYVSLLNIGYTGAPPSVLMNLEEKYGHDSMTPIAD